ncbi:hypothetical protein SAMN05421867_12017 [Cellulomonas marina]|uniref:Uncharacterized protein n=1 Tax=Cellulomonas marina TaxID=988821 RepID=A0A1I1ARH4_9CELL|nr:hypothetical protein SAMN05421867_12017 [Cellulomonas marina]
MPLTTTSYAATDRRLLRVMSVAAAAVLALTAVGSTATTGPGTAEPVGGQVPTQVAVDR